MRAIAPLAAPQPQLDFSDWLPTSERLLYWLAIIVLGYGVYYLASLLSDPPAEDDEDGEVEDEEDSQDLDAQTSDSQTAQATDFEPEDSVHDQAADSPALTSNFVEQEFLREKPEDNHFEPE